MTFSKRNQRFSHLFSPFNSLLELSRFRTDMLLFLTGEARSEGALMGSRAGPGLPDLKWVWKPFNFLRKQSCPFAGHFFSRHVEVSMFLSSIIPFLCFSFIFLPAWALSPLSAMLSTTFSAAILLDSHVFKSRVTNWPIILLRFYATF